MKRHTAGILNGIIASTSYGTNPLFGLPLLHNGIGVNSILFYRYAAAVLIYGLWIKLVKKIDLRVNFAEFITLLALGLMFSFSSLTLFEAFKYIEAGIACTILFIYPTIVAVIMAIFYKEKITLRIIYAILLTFLGIFLLYSGKSGIPLNLKGVGVVLLSALLYALYIVGVKNLKSIRHVKPDKLNFYVMLFGLFVYICNLKFCTELQILTEPYMWLCAAGLAIFPTVISIETINIAIKLIGSTKTAILGALEPLTAIFFGIIFFHEEMTFRIAAGVCFVLFGVMIVITRKKTTDCKR